MALEAKDPTERAKKVLEQAEKLDCKRYLSPKDIVEGSTNLNLAFVAQIFQHRSVQKLTGCTQLECIFPVVLGLLINSKFQWLLRDQCGILCI